MPRGSGWDDEGSRRPDAWDPDAYPAPFLNFFFALRRLGLPVTTTDWFALLRALRLGLAGESLLGFYHLARAVLCHGEHQYDRFDEAFLHVYQGVGAPPEIRSQFFEWLARELASRPLPPDIRELIERDPADLEALLEELRKRLEEQKEEHHGGAYWVGTGGTSPFGWGGENPAGIRLGGEGGGLSAVKIAGERRFRDYRSDIVLDVRQMQVALKKLRVLSREGREEELDLDRTVDRTGRNAGEIDLCYRPARKNRIDLLLLMDVGGSMAPHARRVEQLFSAAHGIDHFHSFAHHYFHNCIYGRLFRSAERREALATEDLLRDADPETRLVLVGDACMGWSELYEPHGCIEYLERSETPGIEWLKRIERHFRHTVWLNPIPEPYWNHPTIQSVAAVFPMKPLTLDGLAAAVEHLRRAV